MTESRSEFESAPDAFPVKLSNFEGPLDLLLHLIKRNELDPTEVTASVELRRLVFVYAAAMWTSDCSLRPWMYGSSPWYSSSAWPSPATFPWPKMPSIAGISLWRRPSLTLYWHPR